jgi:hypothetical protein
MGVRTLVTCDRCVNEFEPPLGHADFSAITLPSWADRALGRVHLCDDCARAFWAWLAAGKQPTDPGPPGEEVPVRLDPRAERSKHRQGGRP